MRKILFAVIVLTAFALAACGNREGEGNDSPGRAADAGISAMDEAGAEAPGTGSGHSGDSGFGSDMTETAGSENSAPGDIGNGTGGPDGETTVQQEGSAGMLQVTLPRGWTYEACPEGSGEICSGDYGIHFYPENVSDGFIELCYMEFFGVCGTGLAEERKVLAGDEANIGVYDNHDYWDFVSFKGKNEGIIALAFGVEGWQSEYVEQALEILDTVSLARKEADGSERTGDGRPAGSEAFGGARRNDGGDMCGLPLAPGAEQSSVGLEGHTAAICGTNEPPREGSCIEELGLTLEIKEYTAANATLVFQQSGGNPEGELFTGDDFWIDRCEDGEWAGVPIVLQGNYGFHQVAYTISMDGDSEFQVDWEWLYGRLEPGEYRIGKSVDDFRKTADFDQYSIYAYFKVTE